MWFTAGGTFSTLRGDCQTCETDTPYRHSGGFLTDLGYRVNGRMDVGGEVFWMPVDTADGRVRTTHIDAVAQFRPWTTHGFFIKGGAGMAFVRNWVDAGGADPFNSKALSVVIGAGWAFRPAERIGFQLFGMQHAAAVGDLQTASGEVADVTGTQPDDVQSMVDADVMRVEASATGGWQVWMPREVLGIDNGETQQAEVYVGRTPGAPVSSEVTLSVTSESDPSAADEATCDVHVRDTRP